MDNLYKLCTDVVRRRHHGSNTQTGGLAGQAVTASSAELSAGTSGGTATGTTELGQPRLPRQAGDDETTSKPRKLNKISVLARSLNLSNLSDARSRSSATSLPDAATLLDRLLALPPELQLKILSYLDFGDIARLRLACHLFRRLIPPALVRSLLAGDFDRAIRYTCRICLMQYSRGAHLVSTDEDHDMFPFSSRCLDCVWLNKDFVVGRKYLLGNDAAVYLCRWCGWLVTTQPAWNQPEFHKQCFKRYTHVVFLYYITGLAQWIIMLVASGLCWHYFKQRSPRTVGAVAAGFVASLWVFCLNAVRGTIMRTYHIALILEAGIIATWIEPLRTLFQLANRRQPSGLNGYETAILVFILFNLVFRSVNVVGNAILLCEYKLWRHKKPLMSPARKAWIHTIEVFIFFVEPQCVEQEYPPRWWFLRRVLEDVNDGSITDDSTSAVGELDGNGPADPPTVATAESGIATV